MQGRRKRVEQTSGQSGEELGKTGGGIEEGGVPFWALHTRGRSKETVGAGSAQRLDGWEKAERAANWD
jgi:hypothetical protein